MIRRSLIAVLLGLFAWLLAGPILSQETVFRVDVRLVPILATVTNTAGELVGSLEKEDFTILDNGVEQEVVAFERRTNQPLSVSLLIDISLSTAKELRYEVESVRRFLRAMFEEGNPRDAVALYSFHHEVALLTSFTNHEPRLDQALRSLKPAGGTSLYDAIYLAAPDLALRDGRRVMVLVTDGGDTTSVKDWHAALEAAQRADAMIYAILVMPITSDAGRNIGGEHALIGLASATGGRVFTPTIGDALDQAFADILRDLRTQYFLAYYPRNIPRGADSFHRIEVKARGENLRVAARSGYYYEEIP
jgi:Ca-activated chloride channel homolog